ncbi:hypothetical protein HYX00_03725 [Candidatus Woesearchaeota archaeon]|nr:hypothetical protein [Candidatus Woesearchaeota archaeon]
MIKNKNSFNKIFLILIFFVFSIWLFGCQKTETYKVKTSDWVVYKSGFGISFMYPKTFTISKEEGLSVKWHINGHYMNPKNQGISTNMLIEKIHEPETVEDVLSRIRNLGIQVLNRKSEDNYEILETNFLEDLSGQGRAYYIISKKGTFYLLDTLYAYRGALEQEKVYQKYREIFDKIRESIKIE